MDDLANLVLNTWARFKLGNGLALNNLKTLNLILKVVPEDLAWVANAFQKLKLARIYVQIIFKNFGVIDNRVQRSHVLMAVATFDYISVYLLDVILSIRDNSCDICQEKYSVLRKVELVKSDQFLFLKLFLDLEVDLVGYGHLRLIFRALNSFKVADLIPYSRAIMIPLYNFFYCQFLLLHLRHVWKEL